MQDISRRDIVLTAAAAAAAFGLDRPLAFIGAARAQSAPAAGQGVRRFSVGDIQMTMLYDGTADRPNERGFVRNASIEDLKGALRAVKMPDDNVPNFFTVPAARVGNRTVLFDAGTGGQIGPSTGLMASNMPAAGIDPAAVDLVLISHFHPDHISGLMARETNAALYPKAEIVMHQAEYAWWTDPAVFARLPEARHGLARRIQAVFPSWKDAGRIRLVGDDVEVVPGIRTIGAPGHTPGHMAFHVSSGRDQLLVLADTVTYEPLFLRNPGWHAAFDADGQLAEANRRRLLQRAVTEGMMVAAYHFTYPAAGRIAKDGDGYAFTPVA